MIAFTSIWLIFIVNVGKYAVRECYGLYGALASGILALLVVIYVAKWPYPATCICIWLVTHVSLCIQCGQRWTNGNQKGYFLLNGERGNTFKDATIDFIHVSFSHPNGDTSNRSCMRNATVPSFPLILKDPEVEVHPIRIPSWTNQNLCCICSKNEKLLSLIKGFFHKP